MRYFLLFLLFQPAFAAEDAYRTCVRLAQSDPSAALRMAERAIQADNQPADQHCRAMALYNLERYDEAATALERLAGRIERENPMLWIQVLRQASRANVQRGELTASLINLNKAVEAVMPDAWADLTSARLLADLLEERAQVFIGRSEPFAALQDLDHALAVQPEDTSALLARAQLQLRLSDRKAAKADAAKLLDLNPNNREGRVLLEKLR